jgi:pilus assembly protein CpaE
MTEIRLLIVDDNPQFTDSLKRMLSFEPDFRIVGAASSGKEALEILAEVPLDVALVDVHLPDMNGIKLTEAIIETYPEVQVIIVSVDYENQVIIDAMRSGAKDYIQKPPSNEILAKSIRVAFKKKPKPTSPLTPLPEPKALGKIIAVYSGKGGVGCTFIATNLALNMNSTETPSVLVDADLQFGDASLYLNLYTSYTIFDLANLETEFDRDVVENVLLMHPEGLKVMAAPMQPELSDSISAELMQNLLEYLRGSYAYVIVDMATELTDISVGIFEMADLILMVMTPDIPSIKNANYVMDLMHRLDIPGDRMEFILNMVGPRDDISPARVGESIGTPIAVQIPFDQAMVKRSINRGDPLILGRQTGPLTLQLVQLVGVVKERLLEQVVVA